VTDFVATIRVRPKAEIRDPQGEAVAGALRSLGVDVADVRTGKEIVVRFSADDLPEASAKARQMGDQLLANPVPNDARAVDAPRSSRLRRARDRGPRRGSAGRQGEGRHVVATQDLVPGDVAADHGANDQDDGKDGPTGSVHCRDGQAGA